jgi:hypothetical protein
MIVGPSISRSVVSSGGAGAVRVCWLGHRAGRPGGRGAFRCGAPDQPGREAGTSCGARVTGDCRSAVYPHSSRARGGPVHVWRRSAGGAPIGHASSSARSAAPPAPGPTRSHPSACLLPSPLAPSSSSPAQARDRFVPSTDFVAPAFTLFSSLIPAQAAISLASRNGRNASPVTHMRCMTTASLRARATSAFFLPIRAARASAQRLRSESS